ncbi:MAG: hypothetical protein COC05_05630 [Gammaproteobacteria bacterium]|nr:MAG: hypothetical protein COC05_05630 [Gammaproteobacteria bacterium]
MATHPGEDEQLEALKKWWNENGTVVIVGFVVGIAVLFGGRAWFDHKQVSSETASAELSLLLNELNVGDSARVADKANEIIIDYASDSQAGFAALIRTKALLESGDTDEAKTLLRSIIDKPVIDGLDELAKLRLARILLFESNYDEALTLIDGDSNAFTPQYQELRGDIYMAQGKFDVARKAYKSALADPSALASGQQLRMKLDSLGDDNLSGGDNS